MKSLSEAISTACANMGVALDVVYGLPSAQHRAGHHHGTRPTDLALPQLGSAWIRPVHPDMRKNRHG